MKNFQKDKRKIKVGIMAASSLQMAILGVASGIPLIMASFPEANPTTIQSIVTIPSLVYIPISLLVGATAAKIGKKKLLLLGIFMICLSGLFPAMVNVSLPMLFLSCAGIGVGNGFLIPLAAGLIPDYFEGLEQGDVMGKQSAFINMGSMLLSIVGGFLAIAHWRNAFLIYLYAIPIFLLVSFCIPKDETKPFNHAGHAPKVRLAKEVYVMSATMFLFGMCFGVFNTNNALLVDERGLGNAATAGLTYSIMSGMGAVSGLLYGKIARVLKKYILPAAIAVVACGMLLMGSAVSTAMLYIGSCICGTGFAVTIPTGLFRVSQSADPDSATFSISIYLAAMNVALFVSAFVMNPLSASLVDGSVQVRYFLSAAGLAALSVFAFLYTRKDPLKL